MLSQAWAGWRSGRSRRIFMAKSREVKKDVKKQPKKSLKEKRLEKKGKKTGKSMIDSHQ
jgi:hypothetical protein